MVSEDNLDCSFDDDLDEKAKKFNMTAIQVRSLLYNVLRDERVVTLAQIKSRRDFHDTETGEDLASILDVDMPSTRLRSRYRDFKNAVQTEHTINMEPEESVSKESDLITPENLAEDFRLSYQNSLFYEKLDELDDEQDDDYVYESSEDDDDVKHLKKLRISKKECLDLINSAEVDEKVDIGSFFKITTRKKTTQKPDIRKDSFIISDEKKSIIKSLFQQHVVLLTILGMLSSQHETLNDCHTSVINLIEEINYFGKERKRVIVDAGNDVFCESSANEALLVLQRWEILNKKDQAIAIFDYNLPKLHSLCECHNGFEILGASFHYSELTKLPYPQLSLKMMGFFMLEPFFVRYPLLLPKKGIDIRVGTSEEKLWKVNKRKRKYDKRKLRKKNIKVQSQVDFEDLEIVHNSEGTNFFLQNEAAEPQNGNDKSKKKKVQFSEPYKEHDTEENIDNQKETNLEIPIELDPQNVDTYSVLLLKSLVPYSSSEDHLIILAYYQWKNRWIDAQINLLPTRNFTHIRTRFATFTRNIPIPNGDVFSLPAPNLKACSSTGERVCLFYTEDEIDLEKLPLWVSKLREVRVLEFVHIQTQSDCTLWNPIDCNMHTYGINLAYAILPVSKMSGCITYLNKIRRVRLIKPKKFLPELSNPVYTIKSYDDEEKLKFTLLQLANYIKTQKEDTKDELESVLQELKDSKFQSLILEFVNSIERYIQLLPFKVSATTKPLTMYDKLKESNEMKKLVDFILGSECFTDKIKFWNIFQMERNNIRELTKNFTLEECNEILRFILDSMTGDVLQLHSDMEKYSEIFCNINFKSDMFPSIFEVVQSTLIPGKLRRYKYENIINLATKSYIIGGEQVRVLDENENFTQDETCETLDSLLSKKYFKSEKKQKLINKESLKLRMKFDHELKSVRRTRSMKHGKLTRKMVSHIKSNLSESQKMIRDNTFVDIYKKLC